VHAGCPISIFAYISHSPNSMHDMCLLNLGTLLKKHALDFAWWFSNLHTLACLWYANH